jgi:hypothetical protein
MCYCPISDQKHSSARMILEGYCATKLFSPAEGAGSRGRMLWSHLRHTAKNLFIARLGNTKPNSVTSHTMRPRTRQDPSITYPAALSPPPPPPRKVATMAVGNGHLGEFQKTWGRISISRRSLVLILMGSSMISLGAGRALSLFAIRGGAVTRLFRGSSVLISRKNEHYNSFCQSNTLSSLWTIPSETQTTLPLFMRQQSIMLSNGTTTTDNGVPDDRSLLRRILGPTWNTDATTQCHSRSVSTSSTTGHSRTSATLFAEAMVHPALLTHEHPRHVLIVTTTAAMASATGNNGHVLCHVLLHRSIERVEILVVATNETSRDFPRPQRSIRLCGGHDDPRVTYHDVLDLTKGLAQFNYADRFDAILVDAMYVASFVHW